MNNIKFSVLLIAVLCCSLVAEAKQKVSTEVSETVELMSTIARLAQYEEYNAFGVPGQDGGVYTTHIDEYFAKYSSHKAVKQLKTLRETCGIGFVAIPSLAVNLDIVDGKVQLADVDLSLLDSRWEKVNLTKFVAAVSDFYVKTNYHKFYMQQLPIFKTTQKNYDEILRRHYSSVWFEKFFGDEIDIDVRVVIGGVNGVNNYVCKRQSKDNKPIIYSVINYVANSNGEPEESDCANFMNGLVTVINRCYIENMHLDAKVRVGVEEVGRKFHQKQSDMLGGETYGSWETMWNISVAQAITIQYFRDNKFTEGQIGDVMFEQMENRGFFWLPGMLDAFERYKNERGEYKNLGEFYPMLLDMLSSVY